MLSAVAAAFPATMSLSRTNASPKRPRTMMMRYSTPPTLARAFGQTSRRCSSMSPPRSAATRRGASAWRRVATLDDDVLDDPGAPAAECGSLLIGIRLKAPDRRFHGRKLDHDEAMKDFGSLHDAVLA